MTNADRLARFPQSLRLGPSPWPNLLGIFMAVLFLGRCSEFAHQGVVWTGILFNGAIILICLLMLMPGSSSLVLQRDALVITSFFRRRILPWSQIRDFAAHGDDYRYAHVKYRDDSLPDPFDKRFGNRNSILSGYRLSKDQLADLLTQWRELALSSQPSPPAQAASAKAAASAPELPVQLAPLSKNAADILAGFPTPHVISRQFDKFTVWIFVVPISLGCLFLAFVMPMVEILKIALPFAIVFACVFGFAKWRNISYHVGLYPDGIEIAHGGTREHYTWDTVQDFIPTLNGSQKRVAFNRIGTPRVWLLERLDRPSWTVSGAATCVLRSSMLPSNYSVPDPELATLLTQWRERALAAKSSGSEPA